MKKKSFLFCFVFIILLQADVTSQKIYGTKSGLISFRSDAPLELITASSKEMLGKLDVGKKIFAFGIKINSFAGFNSPLQREHFNENYLETTQYPNATFTGKIIEDIDFSADGTYSIRAKGNLSIHGVVQERIIKSEVTIKKGVISIVSNFTVLLADHNIAIPKVVYEKLASEIKVMVKADLILQ